MPVVAQRTFTQINCGSHIFRFSCSLIYFSVITELRARIHGVVVACIHLHLHPISTINKFVRILSFLHPVGRRSVIGRTRPHTIILQAAIYIVWFIVVNCYTIKLPDSRSVALEPVLPEIIRNVHSAIITNYHVSVFLRIEPDCMMVAVSVVAIYGFESNAAIFRHDHWYSAQHNFFIIKW